MTERTLRLLTLLDEAATEYTRECLALPVERRMMGLPRGD